MENICMYGYARCSTKEQNEGRQVNALRAFGVPEQNIVVEKMSGKNFDRPLYTNLVKTLKNHDTLVIKSVDRLGRDYKDVIENWRIITREVGAHIVVLDFPILDTRQTNLNLTGEFIAEIVLQILSYLSEMEFSQIKQRQAEGIATAKAKGVKFGRKPKERPSIYEETVDRWQRHEISAREASRQLGISHSTFLRWVKE